MEAYFRVFVNWKQNDWACLLLIATFAYNNAKNASTGFMPFKLNSGFYPRVSFENDVNPYFKSCSADKLAKELRELIDICQQNLLYAQEIQKRSHDKGVKPQSYTPGKKV